MPMQPDFDLAAILDDIWSRLVAGQNDRAHPFYLPAVAIAGVDGAPTVRTVVLRQVDRGARLLAFQTDFRSPKCAAIRANPAVVLLFYDGVSRIQVRAKTIATLHHDDDIARAAWLAVSERNQMNYRSPYPPGTVIPAVDCSPTHSNELRIEAGRENFAVVHCAVIEFDWLMLHPQGHRRIRFKFSGGAVTNEWLVP